MLKINGNINKNKTQLTGSFKLPHSLNGALYNKQKLVDENNTKEVENLIGNLFVDYLRKVENRKVLYFTENQDDSHKNPDLFVHLDGKLIGVQVTQFVLNDYLLKFNQAKRICEKLSKLISNEFLPPIKINVQISTPWNNNELKKTNPKIFKKLSKEIANCIKQNISTLSTKNEYLNFRLNEFDYKDVADDYNLYPVPSTHQSNYFGDNNIYVDYGFDDISISKEDIIDTVNKIYNDKNNGKSEVLLIWGNENEFMNTNKVIIDCLKQKFSKTSFKSVYFLTFHNTLVMNDRVIFCDKIN